MLGWLSELVFLHFGRLVVGTGVWMVLVFYTYVQKTVNKSVKLRS